MSYEAQAHPAQMAMLRQLLMSERARFADLQKASGLLSDSANFHLKQLLSHKFVLKTKPGEYVLTAHGKEYANRMDTNEVVLERQPKMSVVIILEDDNGQQLHQQRLKQPYYGYWSHPTGKVHWGETLLEAAARELNEETGLTADLRIAGFHHRLDYNQTTLVLLEDKYFCVVHGTKPRGALMHADGTFNKWMSDEEFLKQEKRFGDVAEVKSFIHGTHQQVLETQHHYEPGDY